MEITKERIDSLALADYNPRVELKPGDAEYESLRRSIEAFQQVLPIVVNRENRRVVGGHQRLRVLQDLGEEDVWVAWVEVGEVQERALNIALNKIDAGWDQTALGATLATILEEKNYSLTGFADAGDDPYEGVDWDSAAESRAKIQAETFGWPGYMALLEPTWADTLVTLLGGVAGRDQRPSADVLAEVLDSFLTTEGH